MKKFVTPVVVFALCATIGSAYAFNSVRISQVYGGGGNTGAVYNQDFVELFNNSGSPVSLTGWSIQYGSAAGTTGWGSGSNTTFNFPDGATIGPCKYLLIGMAFGANTGLPALPTVDYTGLIAMSATAGKVALISNATAPTACSGSVVGGVVVDNLGWGATAVCYEGAVAPGTANGTGSIRAGGGTTDTDNNSSDFSTAAPVARNSASPANVNCLATPATPQSWGMIKTIYR